MLLNQTEYNSLIENQKAMAESIKKLSEQVEQNRLLQNERVERTRSIRNERIPKEVTVSCCIYATRNTLTPL